MQWKSDRKIQCGVTAGETAWNSKPKLWFRVSALVRSLKWPTRFVMQDGAAWLARLAHNEKVTGSNPVPATNLCGAPHQI